MTKKTSTTDNDPKLAAHTPMMRQHLPKTFNPLQIK